MIGKVKYIGKTFGASSLTNGKIYNCLAIESSFLRIIDDSDEDYLYSIVCPGSLENPDLCGRWVVVDDPKGILKGYILI